MAIKSPTEDESTATSSISTPHICAICFKEFSSGHALGGHQNAHRYEKIFMNRIPKTIEAASRNQLSLAPAKYLPLAARDTGTEILRSMGGQGYGILKIKKDHHQYHPYPPYPKPIIGDEAISPRLPTKDLMGGRLAMKNGVEWPKKTITNPFIGNSKGVKEGEEELDLDLKLGF